MTSSLSVNFAAGVQFAAASGDPAGLKKERTDAFSLFCWAATNNASTRSIVGKYETSTNRGYAINRETGGQITVYISNGIGNRITVQTIAAAFGADSQFRFLGFTYDGSSAASGVVIYVNGQAYDVTVIDDTLSATIDHAVNFQVSGVDGTAGTEWLGNVDEVTFYNDALTAGEVLNLWHNGDPVDPRTIGPTSKLVSYWPMGELDTFPSLRDRGGGFAALAGSSTILDRSQNNHTGSTTNMEDADFTTDTPGGRSKYSATLDGVNEYFTWGNVADFAFERTDTFSFSWWMKCSGTPGHDEFLVSKQGSGTPEGYVILVQNSGNLVLYLVNTFSTNNLAVRVATSLRDGVWHHVVVAYGGGSDVSDVDIYVDNVLQSNITVFNNLTSTIVHASAQFLFGTRTLDLTNYYSGQVDDLAVYNKKLTTSDVAAIWNSGAPTDNTTLSTEPNLIGYWGMGEAYADLTMSGMIAGDIEAVFPESVLLTDFSVPDLGDVVFIGGAGGGKFYKMRALADPGPGYETWVVSGTPDFTGASAGGPIQAGTAIVADQWS